MKHTFCLLVFAVCLTAELAFGHSAPFPGAETYQDEVELQPLQRMVRQMPDKPPPPPEGMPPPPEEMPPPPEGMPPPPDGMPPPPGARKRREAKGGGSMPTRKG